jgi:hypothetical protein
MIFLPFGIFLVLAHQALFFYAPGAVFPKKKRERDSDHFFLKNFV